MEEYLVLKLKKNLCIDKESLTNILKKYGEIKSVDESNFNFQENYLYQEITKLVKKEIDKLRSSDLRLKDEQDLLIKNLKNTLLLINQTTKLETN
jgi:hypothetical protein